MHKGNTRRESMMIINLSQNDFQQDIIKYYKNYIYTITMIDYSKNIYYNIIIYPIYKSYNNNNVIFTI